MATVTKRGASYLVRWYRLDGRQTGRSCPDLGTAKRLALAVEQARALGVDRRWRCAMGDERLVTCADNREWLASLERDSFDVCLSDPPYADETHDNARSYLGAGGELIRFASIDFSTLRDTLGIVGTITRRWVVLHCDWRHAAKLADNPPAGLRFVRFGVWVKPNGAPQFTGDRPAQGWEAMAWLHRDGVKLEWNGKGRSSVFSDPRHTGPATNKTKKPISLARQLVQLTTSAGPVLDPWCGEGTFGVACAERGVPYAGCDIDPKMVAIAEDAIATVRRQGALFLPSTNNETQDIIEF